MSLDSKVQSMLEDWFEEALAEGMDEKEAEKVVWMRFENHPLQFQIRL